MRRSRRLSLTLLASTRERAGAAVNVKLRPQDGSSYYLRSMFSRFSDDETRPAHIVEFADPQTQGTLGDAESTRELKDHKETQRIFSLTLGTDQQFNDWTLYRSAMQSWLVVSSRGNNSVVMLDAAPPTACAAPFASA